MITIQQTREEIAVNALRSQEAKKIKILQKDQAESRSH